MIFGTLHTVFSFIVVLGILVSIHEFGHFWVARNRGVKVLRFSIGFGKSLWTRTDRHGTEFSVSLIPLGGYVKMLDEREGDVPDNEKHLSFNSKSALARTAIVAAGPAANFLLAIVALWIMYMVGIRTLIPLVGEVLPESPAASAGIMPGDEIVAVEGHETLSWQSINMELLSYIGETKVLNVSVRSDTTGSEPDRAVIDRSVKVVEWKFDEEHPNPIKSLGVVPYTPEIPAVVGHLEQSGAGAEAGLQHGDRVLSINFEPITNWNHLVEIVRSSPDQSLNFLVDRSDEQINITLTPKSRLDPQQEGGMIGFIGVGVQAVNFPEDLVRNERYDLVQSLAKSIQETWSLTCITFSSLWKMITGLLSLKNLSGPITIAKVASASIESGLESFLYFLAMLSVSLGAINLLPVPVLDGGHLLFYIIEMVRGKPLSEKSQAFGMKVGMILIAGVMIIALHNDIGRIFW